MKPYYQEKWVTITKGEPSELDDIVKCLDDNLVAEGFGFVNKMQIQTELNRGTIWVARYIKKIIGVRVGKLTLWNIVIAKDYRGHGLGKKLMEVCMPNTIRVKNEPIGHLSKQQKQEFVDPTGFYESMGYMFWGKDKGRNFWQKGKNKAQFHKEGKVAHISIFKRMQSLLFK